MSHAPPKRPVSFLKRNGAVWPHDNGIIAMGCRRYGFAEEAARIARDVSGAASYFMLHQGRNSTQGSNVIRPISLSNIAAPMCHMLGPPTRP